MKRPVRPLMESGFSVATAMALKRAVAATSMRKMTSRKKKARPGPSAVV